MPSRSLPERPHLTQLRNQASELRRDHRDGHRSAAARIAAHHPRFKGMTVEETLAVRLSVSDAQLVLAREYGFPSWPAMKQHVDVARLVAACEPHPRFEEALAAVDAGDKAKLNALLGEAPELVSARTNLVPPFGYFTGAMLLHHLAWNPGRDSTPKHVPAMAEALLDAGAEVDATTFGPNRPTTLTLVLSSKQASDAGISGDLIEVLLDRGASVDLAKPDLLHFSLANHAVGAAKKLAELGAKVDLCSAAALGRLDLVRDCFDEGGVLCVSVRRDGSVLSERDAIGLALLFAYVNQKPAVVDFLLEMDGNWDMIGVNNGTALHRAAWAGDLAMVQRLVERGADVNNRENPFTATPLSWARHNDQSEMFEWLHTHGDVDLHDAASFGLMEIVARHLEKDPDRVHHVADQWQIPQGTALHCAASAKQVDVVGRLLDAGADVNAVAGNGLTALDLAVEKDAGDVAELLREKGGVRAGEMLG